MVVKLHLCINFMQMCSVSSYFVSMRCLCVPIMAQSVLKECQQGFRALETQG